MSLLHSAVMCMALTSALLSQDAASIMTFPCSEDFTEGKKKGKRKETAEDSASTQLLSYCSILTHPAIAALLMLLVNKRTSSLSYMHRLSGFPASPSWVQPYKS